MEETQGARRIEAADLSDLQQASMKREKFANELGLVAMRKRELVQAEEQIFEELDAAIREERFMHARILRKYGLEENARIDISTGEIAT